MWGWSDSGSCRRLREEQRRAPAEPGGSGPPPAAAAGEREGGRCSEPVAERWAGAAGRGGGRWTLRRCPDGGTRRCLCETPLRICRPPSPGSVWSGAGAHSFLLFPSPPFCGGSLQKRKAAPSKAPQGCVLSAMARMCGGSMPAAARAALGARRGHRVCGVAQDGAEGGRAAAGAGLRPALPALCPVRCALLRWRGRHLRAEGLQGNRSKKRKMLSHAHSWIWKSLHRKLECRSWGTCPYTKMDSVVFFEDLCVFFPFIHFYHLTQGSRQTK